MYVDFNFAKVLYSKITFGRSYSSANLCNVASLVEGWPFGVFCNTGSPCFSYKISKSVKTDIGFWTGDVDENENQVLLINGMENWSNVHQSKSKLYLFSLDGLTIIG